MWHFYITSEAIFLSFSSNEFESRKGAHKGSEFQRGFGVTRILIITNVVKNIQGKFPGGCYEPQKESESRYESQGDKGTKM